MSIYRMNKNGYRLYMEMSWKSEFAELILQMTEQADDFYLSLLSALDGGVPTEQLMEIQQSLAELI